MDVLKAPDTPVQETTNSLDDLSSASKTDINELCNRYHGIKNELKSNRLTLRKKPSIPAYIGAMLALIKIEEDSDSIERLLTEMETFLEKRLASEPEISIRNDLLEMIKTELKDNEIAFLIKSPNVCKEILKRYPLEGEHWKEPLNIAANKYSSEFVRGFGTVLINNDKSLLITDIEWLISSCQEKLIIWLINYLKNNEPPYPIQRLLSIIKCCTSNQVVHLADLLLKEIDPAASLSLVHRLIDIDSVQSIRIVINLLSIADESTRETILRLLGRSSQQAVEQILIRVADLNTTWKGNAIQERMVALTSIHQCGTSQSVSLLTKLSSAWLLLLTHNGRLTRKMASDALRTVKERLLQ